MFRQGAAAGGGKSGTDVARPVPGSEGKLVGQMRAEAGHAWTFAFNLFVPRSSSCTRPWLMVGLHSHWLHVSLTPKLFVHNNTFTWWIMALRASGGAFSPQLKAGPGVFCQPWLRPAVVLLAYAGVST